MGVAVSSDNSVGCKSALSECNGNGRSDVGIQLCLVFGGSGFPNRIPRQMMHSAQEGMHPMIASTGGDGGIELDAEHG